MRGKTQEQGKAVEPPYKLKFMVQRYMLKLSVVAQVQI